MTDSLTPTIIVIIAVREKPFENIIISVSYTFKYSRVMQNCNLLSVNHRPVLDKR